MSGHYFFKLLILIVFDYKYGCFLGFYFQQSLKAFSDTKNPVF
ncbi:hypothetical protein [uncultured Gammaproteobacteria bacterium]|nr:hypothetical protein [uncultured Gammaproteobacteria bacterium]